MGETVLLLISVLVVGGLGALIVPPAIQAAMEREPELLEPEGGAALAVFDRLRALFGSAHAMVGVWERPGGGLEVALWQTDVRDPGVVNADELLLLVFSPVLGSLTAYIEGAGAKGPALEGVEIEGDQGPARGVALQRAVVLRRDFPDWWRSRPGTERRVVAAGLASVRVMHGGPASEGEGLETWRVELLWAPVASDGVGEKGVFEVAVRRLGAE